MCFKIDWASLYLEENLPFLLCLTLYLGAPFPSTSPTGAYILRGDLTKGFLRYEFVRLIFGGAYTWRGLFSEFYGVLTLLIILRLLLNTAAFRRSPSSAGALLEEDTRREGPQRRGTLTGRLCFFIAKVVVVS